jgi:long-chain acyl-CoA synthetase
MANKLLWDEIASIADSDPARVALITDDRVTTYGELAEQAAERAARLRAAGMRTGDRVMLISTNSTGYLIWAFAVWRAGCILATVYPESGADELDYVLRNSQPRCIISDVARTSSVTSAVLKSGLPIDIHTIDDSGDVVSLPVADEWFLPSIDPEAVALISYTSGTTAAPKPAAHSHRGLTDAARAYARVWRMSPDDRTLVCLPMAWVYGLISASLVTLIAGGAVVPLQRFSPVRVIDAIERHAVTFFPGVTTMYVKMVAYLRDAGREARLNSLRLNISGGEGRNEAVFDQWRELGGRPVLDAYCSVECIPVITYDPEQDPEPRRGSAGRVVAEADMRILGHDGVEVARGDVGIALWRSPGLMVGYWNEPDLTAEAVTPDGWFRTGDYVRVDDDGYVYIVGRVDDMIIRGGSNVSPSEVEAVLTGDPRITEAAVIGLSDPEYTEAVAAVIVTADRVQLSDEDLTRLCAERLAPYKVPTVFRQVGELPRNASGKVQRTRLASLFEPSPVAGWSDARWET